MQWKDRSSFSQGDKVRTPTTFEAIEGSFRICVTRNIHYAPTEWVLICEPWFGQTVISTGTADEAKEAAIIAVRKKLAETLDVLTPNA